MDTLTAITQRRSVKNFQPGYQMPDEDLSTLVETAMLTPSSFNIQHCRIVRVTDPQQRQAMRTVAFDQAQVTDASELWVLSADIQAWQKEPQRYWRLTEPEKRDFIINMLTEFYEGKPQLQRDEAVRSCGLMAQTIMLTAKSLGYDSCPMIGFDAEKIAEIINLPDDHLIGMMIAMGKATEPAWPRSGSLPMQEIIVSNRFA